jgi:hypothetical protein
MARKQRPAPTAAKGRIVGQRYDEERGIWLYDIKIESPDEPEPAPWKPTLKQTMILAIVRRDYRGRSLPSVAVIRRHITNNENAVWKAECVRRKLKEIKPGQYEEAAPGRDTIDRTLRAASLMK